MRKLPIVVGMALVLSASLFILGGSQASQVTAQTYPIEIEVGPKIEQAIIRHTNPQGRTVDIAGWMILSLGSNGPEDIDQIFRFRRSACRLEPGTQIAVTSGSDSLDPNNSGLATCSRHNPIYWDVTGNGPRVWSQSSDTACLLDEHLGLVDEYKVNSGTSDCKDDYSDDDGGSDS